MDQPIKAGVKRRPSEILLEQRKILSPKTDLPRTPYPLLETVLQGANGVGSQSTERMPDATSIPTSGGNRQLLTSEDSTFDVHYKLSPTMLKKATNSVLQQVDWWKVVADVGGEGTALTYRDAFEDILATKIGELRSQGQTYSGRNWAGESGNESLSTSSFIENNTDDSSGADFEVNGSEETDEEGPEEYEFCDEESNDGKDLDDIDEDEEEAAI